MPRSGFELRGAVLKAGDCSVFLVCCVKGSALSVIGLPCLRGWPEATCRSCPRLDVLLSITKTFT